MCGGTPPVGQDFMSFVQEKVHVMAEFQELLNTVANGLKSRSRLAVGRITLLLQRLDCRSHVPVVQHSAFLTLGACIPEGFDATTADLRSLQVMLVLANIRIELGGLGGPGLRTAHITSQGASDSGASNLATPAVIGRPSITFASL